MRVDIGSWDIKEDESGSARDNYFGLHYIKSWKGEGNLTLGKEDFSGCPF